MKRIILIGLMLIGVWTTHAQGDGGQFWVRSFEDRDGDGIRDAGEPLITRGVSVELLDAGGMVIASALLDQSPNATQGLIGFQYLPPGQYTAVVTSADLTATTPTQFTVDIAADALPTVVDFGGQRIAPAPPSALEAAAQADAERSEIVRLAASGLGALVMIGLMTLIGVVLYASVLRPRAIRAANLEMMRATRTSTSSGTMRPVTTTQEDLDRFKPKS